MTEQELNNNLSEICNSEEFATKLFALAFDYNSGKINKSLFICDFTNLLPEAHSVIVKPMFGRLYIVFEFCGHTVKFTIKYYNIISGVAESCQLFYSIIDKAFED